MTKSKNKWSLRSPYTVVGGGWHYEWEMLNRDNGLNEMQEDMKKGKIVQHMVRLILSNRQIPTGVFFK